ncbi:MAG: phosphopantetheine-binding protein [Candidatus Contendobacter sp.]|nr:phosphopantetheine-binding protein [Candidatus Contendobacter sp.]MDG4558694.1 phosphopantetheine-binding protein [Candidatus Contendobacter sp.]
MDHFINPNLLDDLDFLMKIRFKTRKKVSWFILTLLGKVKTETSAMSARKSLDFRGVLRQTDVAAQHADPDATTGFEPRQFSAKENLMNATSQTQIRETILRVLGDIAPNANVQTINPDISFHDQIEFDSIDFLRLMMSLEKEMNVTIFDFDYPKLSTLKGCERYLSERLAATA